MKKLVQNWYTSGTKLKMRKLLKKTAINRDNKELCKMHYTNYTI